MPTTDSSPALPAQPLLPAIRAPRPSRLLDAWEAGAGQPLARRALILLMAAYPATDRDVLLAWPVGRRDLHLLALRAACFGPHVESVADCPACGARIELAFDVADVVAQPTVVAPLTDQVPAAQYPDNGPGTQQVTVDWNGRARRFRLPDAGDLVALSVCNDPDEARRLLVQRCSLDADAGDVTALPEAVGETLAARMAEADPQADVWLGLSCPACAHRWLAGFDIAAHLWAEVDVWAQRTLLEVHELARAYGWREEETLALSPWRRQHYLGLVARTNGGQHGRA